MSIKRKSFCLFLIIFSFVHLVFNFQLWRELVFDQSDTIHVSDGTITEFINEVGYQKIITGKNPFSFTDQVLYPFGINYSMNDPSTANSILFILTRPFLNIHKSLLLIVLLNIYLAGILMYSLLLKFSKSASASGLFAMIYTFMPFISHRLLGHFTYTPIYIFPLFGLISWHFLKTKSARTKFWLSLPFGALLSFSLYSNFYYFIMIGLSLTFFLIWNLFKNPKKLMDFVFKNFKFILLAGGIFVITLSPWLMEAKNYFLFEGRSNAETLGSAIHYSADILGFIIPNNYNLIYNQIFTWFASAIPQTQRVYSFYTHSWERFVYPGLILLITYVFILFNRKKIQKTKEWSKLLPFLTASLIFGVFLLGPFLKFAGKWSLNLDGVAVVIPLPFLIFNYLPVLNSLRVPTRFMPIVTFYASIVGVYILTYFLKNKSKSFSNIFMVSIFSIFFIDHFYILPEKISSPVPIKLYQEIARDDSESRVLEIPYTVRDGFEYLGFVHALAPMQGALIHHKQIMGGYLARVAPEVFTYYQNLNFLGYVADVTDKGNYNPYYEQPTEPTIAPYSLTKESVEDELDFFGIKYVMLKKNEKYTPAINKVLSPIIEETVMQDGDYWLYKRDVNWSNDFSKIDFTKIVKPYFLGRGLGIAENSYLMTDGKAIVFLRPNQIINKNLIIKASADDDSAVNVYVNRHLQGQLQLSNQVESSSFELGGVEDNQVIPIMLQIVDQEVSDPKIRFYEMSIK